MPTSRKRIRFIAAILFLTAADRGPRRCGNSTADGDTRSGATKRLAPVLPSRTHCMRVDGQLPGLMAAATAATPS
ncbi:MAG: hypothetical protein PVI07_03610, partial [Anaerolineae bacterium]